MSNESRPQRDANAVVGLDQSNVKRVHILGCVVRERIDLYRFCLSRHSRGVAPAYRRKILVK